MFDETKAKALHAAAEKIENVLQNQLTEIKEKLTDMHNTITDTVPIHCTIVPIETCTSTYPRLRQRRQVPQRSRSSVVANRSSQPFVPSELCRGRNYCGTLKMSIVK